MSYLIDNKISFYKKSPYKKNVLRIIKIFTQIEKIFLNKNKISKKNYFICLELVKINTII